MSAILDVVPLRSLIAVVDCGGFQRAASALHLSQGAVSQHVRRLESAIGRPLLDRDHRGVRLTSDGEMLLPKARQLLAVHDEILRDFAVTPKKTTITVGSSEHVAGQLLPQLAGLLNTTFPDHKIRIRLDRGEQLRTALDNGTVDIALLLGPAADDQAQDIGELELTWYSAPSWRPSDGEPLPLVSIDEPCALRRRALDTLAEHGIAADVVCDAAHLAGFQSAVRAGLGVGLMATIGQHPDGLVRRFDLPVAAPIPLSVRVRRGLNLTLVDSAAQSLRAILAA
ncbi:MAG TPA: LysR substrate-binding domain-containing protein [Trebonia sp.]|jgi:DNA-binding transcriptional LysR family regulator